MKKKIVSLFIMALVFCCTISTASIVKNEKNNFDDYNKTKNSSNFGDTFLYPPWTYGSNWEGWDEDNAGYGGEVTCNSYGGDIYLWVWASGLWGAAGVEGFIVHHPSPNFVAPCDGYYDFTFTYSYYGYLAISASSPFEFDAVVETDIYIKFVLNVLSSPDSYVKEITLDEGEYHEDHDRDWDDTKDISFNDIYVLEGTEVFLSVTMFVDKLDASAAGVETNANGQVSLNGELKKIKVNVPCNSPPNKPSKPSGPTFCRVGNSYPYTSIATDSDDDNIYYLFDWGDGTNSGWLGPYPSGAVGKSSKTWYNANNYEIRVKAKDVNEKESVWSDSLLVSVTKSRTKTSVPLLILFEKLSNAFPMLKLLLQR